MSLFGGSQVQSVEHAEPQLFKSQGALASGCVRRHNFICENQKSGDVTAPLKVRIASDLGLQDCAAYPNCQILANPAENSLNRFGLATNAELALVVGQTVRVMSRHQLAIVKSSRDAMRTTLTLDPAIAKATRKRMQENRASMKSIVNDALREGLKVLENAPQKKDFRFKVKPHDFGFRPGIDLNKLNQFADDLEDQERMAKMAR